MRELYYIAVGYLSGSVLYARVFGRLLHSKDITKDSLDHNPGTANAFMYGGLWCGILTLLFDILKGLVPVYCYFHGQSTGGGLILEALVLSAPVMGHIFPVFHRFQGGKGIAVSFGCLLGVFPYMVPVGILAFHFIFFSVIFRVSPHYYRTTLTYLASAAVVLFLVKYLVIRLGFYMMTALIEVKMAMSPEERGKCKVEYLWKS